MSVNSVKIDNDFQMPWYHGNLSREKTEKSLRGCSDGTFLIRNSTNFPGDYTLCVSCKFKVEHYRIYITNDQYTCDKEELFDSLTQLVSHYKRDSDGLCCRLIAPYVSEAFKVAHDSANIEERRREFDRAGVLLSVGDLKLGNIIGHGEFGDVLSGYYKGRKVAVKTLKNGMASDLLIEARFMIGLRHSKLVELIGVVMEDAREVYMLTEYMANGNLVDFLRSRGRHQVDHSQLIQFAEDVAEGMAYMESRNFVHRDLAARNILLDEQLVAKVSDFGLAQVVNVNQPTKDSMRGKFPIKWSAPEALRHSQFTNKSDVWSFGVLLWEIFAFGRPPYPRIPIQDVLRHVEKGYRMDAPEACPAPISALMTDCWGLDPRERPSFAEILTELRALSLSDFNGCA